MATVSICCPAFNEEANISLCLRSILADAASLPCDWELLVCASGCTDHTTSVVESICLHDPRVRLIRESERLGKLRALGTLLQHAHGEMILMTDADVEWIPGSGVSLLTPLLTDPRVGLVTPRVVVRPLGRRLLDRIAELSCEYWNTLRQIESDRGTLWSVPGYLYAIRRRAVPDLPARIINDDALIGLMVQRAGFRVVHDPVACVRIGYPTSWVDYLRQKIRTRFGWLQLRRASAAQPVTLPHTHLQRLVLSDLLCPSGKRV